MVEQRYIRDVMTQPVITTGHAATVADALATMREYDLSALPVVDEQQRLVGVVNNLQLIVAAALDRFEQPLSALGLSLKVAAGVICLQPEEPIKDAVLKIVKHNVGQLMVVDAQQRCVGVVSRRDLVRYFVERQRGLVSAEEVAGFS